jgi:hypothetical protein
MSNKAIKLPKPKKQRQKAAKPEARISPLGVLLALATLIGGIAAVATFFPRITVLASDPVDPNDPFSSTVTVTNTGFLPLNSVGYAVALRYISFLPAASLRGNEDYSSLLIPDSGRGRDLGIDDKFSFPFNSVIDGSKDDLNNADFAILVHYELPILHWHRQKLFPLEVTRQSNGSFYWFAKPEPKHYTVTSNGYRISGTIHIPHKAN